MTIQQLVAFLRQSVMVQDPEVAVVDEDFLQMKEEDLVLLLQIALSKVAPEENLSTLSQENIYPTILVAKKELYHRLAVKSAPKYDLTSSSGAELHRDDIFNHYYKLIDDIEKEYNRYMSTGRPVIAGQVLLDSKYFTMRNYNLATNPVVTLSIDNVYNNSVEVSWIINKINKFAKFEVYVSEKAIIDVYKNNAISKEATKVNVFNDIHTHCTRVENLKPNTEYHVAVIIYERNGLTGYSELTFTTLEV